VQVDTWGGFLFVNLDPAAAPLVDFLGAMPQRWEEYHADWVGLREVKRVSYEEAFNWKIFMENSVDYYHVPFIHQETLEMPPVIKNYPAGQHFMLTTTTPEVQYTRYFDLLFPNVYFHVGTSKIQMFRVLPLAPDRSHLEVIFYQTPAQAEAYPVNDPTKHRDIKQILSEDFEICRVLQQQARSRAFAILHSAKDLEEGVAHFDRTLLAALSHTTPSAEHSYVNGDRRRA
jgi:choline monooxygenase